MKFIKYIILLLFLAFTTFAQQIELINATYLGNEKRNYYGETAPDSLNIIWKTPLGKGLTKIGSKERWWKGSGWTGQPLMVKEDGKPYLIHGSLSHFLRKINAETGEIIWEYEFPDAIKGTGTLWNDPDSGLIILQGSRRGVGYSTWSSNLHPLRAISYKSGKEIWRYHLERGASYSVDVDGTPLILNDTVYVGLENARFVVFDPAVSATKEFKGYKRPVRLEKHSLYDPEDMKAHGQNIITESSPSRIGDHVYISSGAGHVYGYNLKTRKIDWDFFIGADMDGSPTVTYDDCILVSVEKQYIEGQGGVFKLDPSKAADSSCVVWYFPTENDSSENATWEGGVIGTAAVNDLSKADDLPYLAAISAIDGYLYLVEHDHVDTSMVWGPNLKHKYHKPRFIASRWIGQSISTPLMIGRSIVAAGYSGVSLFKFNSKGKLYRVERKYIGGIESTPFVYDGKVYVGSRDGYIYCLGN